MEGIAQPPSWAFPDHCQWLNLPQLRSHPSGPSMLAWHHDGEDLPPYCQRYFAWLNARLVVQGVVQLPSHMLEGAGQP